MRIVAFFSAVWLFTGGRSHAEWPQFRGPNNSGVVDGAGVPIEFGPGENELWNLPLESGHSSPIVAGNAIFSTTYEKLFCTAGDGTITVLGLGNEPSILAVNKMGENTCATPASVDGTLYVRTQNHLFAFRSAAEPQDL